MYWTGGKNGPRFIRPIRWLVALLGDQVVPLEIAGVHAGNITRGHRKLGSASIPVTIDDYRDRLASNGVILSANDRREKIEREMTALLDQTGLHVRRDPDLLETLVYITEHPTPILGGFDEQYLELPSEVLVTVMRHHQKYFSVEDASHELAPRFIAVMNTNADPDGLVRRGNERVLRARFNDARFFWEMDQHKKLADRVADLANVTFQAKLGSYLEKTQRNIVAARELAEMAGVDAALVERAALLLKADLTTEMVKEFTDLQGIIGGLYAKAQGEPEEVWRAVYDHYKPVGMEDSIPATAAGRLVALADKLDTLRGCFRVGLMPTGSKDPFALRRAAQGVVRILVEGQLEFPLSTLAGDSKELREFLLDRVKYYFREVSGFAYDEVNAVLASGSDNLPDIEARLTALKAVRPTENFEPLAASFKRIQNILRQAAFSETASASRALLEDGPEQRLYDEFQRVRDAARTTEYLSALQAIASLRPSVDLFFDKVLVNAPDPNVRRNRLALLNGILTEFSTIADFSEIVTNFLGACLMKQYVYAFGEGKADGDGKMKDVLGGKGAGLAEMSRTGVPVPPGFTVATDVCNIYFQNNNTVPDDIEKQVDEKLAQLEKRMGQKLGDSANPLLVSVRSGAKFSMPGMMDTVLNLGLNDQTVEGLVAKSSNPRFAYDCYRRFIQMFSQRSDGDPERRFRACVRCAEEEGQGEVRYRSDGRKPEGSHRRL